MTKRFIDVAGIAACGQNDRNLRLDLPSISKDAIAAQTLREATLSQDAS